MTSLAAEDTPASASAGHASRTWLLVLPLAAACLRRQRRPLPRSSLPGRGGRPVRMRSCPARGMRRTLTAHAASELAVIGWRFANCWLPILVGAAACRSLRLPLRRSDPQAPPGPPGRLWHRTSLS